MAILAWMPRNVSLPAEEVKTFGKLYLYSQGNSISNPDLSWVPTPTNSIYHIAYQASTDNVGATQGYYESKVMKVLINRFIYTQELLESQPFWGLSFGDARVWAEAYRDSGGILTIGQGGAVKVALAYGFYDANRVKCVGFDQDGGATNALVDTTETTGYIFTEDYAPIYQMTRQGGGGAGIQFWGTEHKSDTEFVTLANYFVNLLNLSGDMGDSYPFADASTAAGALDKASIFHNWGGGVSLSILDGSTFGGMNTNSIIIVIGTDDNGEYSEREFTGNWIADGTVSGTSVDNYTIDGFVYAIDLLFELKIYSPTMLVANLSGTIDENYAIVTWSVTAVYGI